MNNKLVILIFISIVFSFVIKAEKPVKDGEPHVLKELLKPRLMRVGPKNIYLSDQYFVLYYSRDNLTLTKKVGGKGEGPGQFRSKPSFRSKGNRLYVSAVSQIAIFTDSGELLEEKRHGKMFIQPDYLNGKYFVSYMPIDTATERMGGAVYSILGPDFKELKVLHTAVKEEEMKRLTIKLISDTILYQVYKDKIYLAKNENGFYIEVFDASGNLIKKITREYNKIEPTEEIKKKKIKWIQERLKRVPRWASKKWTYIFSKYLPPMQDFRIVDDRIYVKTYHLSGQNVQFVILDLDGKLLGKKYLPDIDGDYYDIRDNRFFYLVDDENEEAWVLHSLEIVGK